MQDLLCLLTKNVEFTLLKKKKKNILQNIEYLFTIDFGQWKRDWLLSLASGFSFVPEARQCLITETLSVFVLTIVQESNVGQRITS